MNADWKKQLERSYLDKLQVALTDFPAGEIRPSEAPDFIIDANDGTLGIEVTGIYHTQTPGQQPLQAIERLREYVVTRAQAIHESRGGPPLYVNAYFSPNARFSKGGVEACAQQLAALVESIDIRANAYEFDGHRSSRRRSLALPPELSDIRIYQIPGQVERFWSAPGGGFVPECAPNDLQTVLDTKEQLFDTYRSKCERVWLLVVINGFALSASLELPEHTLAAQYPSRFDRVFILENHRNRVWELSLVR
jgi:hypothetical protein